METLSKADVQRALINVTKSERAALNVPADFSEVDWGALDFYGWRDPKFPMRGWLVRPQAQALTAVAVRTNGGGLVPGRKAMCAICHAVDNSTAVALFTARRTGSAGRAGNTVGTYICSGLDCSAQLHHPGDRDGRTRLDRDQDTDAVAEGMVSRLDAFIEAVRAA